MEKNWSSIKSIISEAIYIVFWCDVVKDVRTKIIEALLRNDNVYVPDLSAFDRA